MINPNKPDTDATKAIPAAQFRFLGGKALRRNCTSDRADRATTKWLFSKD
jgi:hypothetical protein